MRSWPVILKPSYWTRRPWRALGTLLALLLCLRLVWGSYAGHRLAAALDELLGDPARARQLGAIGRQAVQEKFSVAAMTVNIEAILQKVAHAR